VSEGNGGPRRVHRTGEAPGSRPGVDGDGHEVVTVDPGAHQGREELARPGIPGVVDDVDHRDGRVPLELTSDGPGQISDRATRHCRGSLRADGGPAPSPGRTPAPPPDRRCGTRGTGCR